MSARPTTLRVTILVDEEAPTRGTAEHGFAAFLEWGEHRLLFDTGQGEVLAANAAACGVLLTTVEDTVLSHGHYDHTGGIPAVLAAAPAARFWSLTGIDRPRYSRREGTPRAIGLPDPARRALASLPPEQLRCADAAPAIVPGAWLTGPIPRLDPREDTGGPFFLDAAGQWPDPLADEQALWFPTSRGPIVIVGCCHAGLVNTLRRVQEQSGDHRVRAVIGGLHLGAASEERLAHTLDELARRDLERLVPCHCTGARAFGRLQQALGERVCPGGVGARFEFAD